MSITGDERNGDEALPVLAACDDRGGRMALRLPPPRRAGPLRTPGTPAPRGSGGRHHDRRAFKGLECGSIELRGGQVPAYREGRVGDVRADDAGAHGRREMAPEERALGGDPPYHRLQRPTAVTAHAPPAGG